MIKVVVKQTLVAVLVAVILGGCAVREHLKRGERFLKAGEHDKAIAAYEEALRISPGHERAHEGIRTARRAAVRDKLKVADEALSAGELAAALRHAMQARRMPLDLEDTELVRRIDGTVDEAAKLAGETVNQYIHKGHFLSAVELSEQIVEASAGAMAREDWAANVKKSAIEYYTSQAQELGSKGFAGSAAIQLAMAKRLGAEVEVTDIQQLWNRFAEPTCFAEPAIDVVAKSDQAKGLSAKIETTARRELETLRAQCGEGMRPLGVEIALSKVEIVDDQNTTRAYKPLPGVELKTEEEYFVEEPYTVVEEVTEYDVKMEQKERRDCAPLPGQPRGCRTWVEDVEVKIPKTVKKEVEKVRRIRKTRPVTDPLPPEKVLSYDVTTVSRQVSYEGVVELNGEAETKRSFTVSRESTDASNDAASKQGLTIPADPLDAKSVSALAAEAAEGVAQEVQASVAAAVTKWAADYEAQARERVVNGSMALAEETYLKLLALGAEGSENLSRFFDDRYGRPVGDVMFTLAVGLGRQSSERAAVGGPTGRERTRFPTRGPEPDTVAQPAEAKPETTPEATKVPDAVATPEKPATPMISDDELADLEKASMDVLVKPKPKAVTGEVETKEIVGEVKKDDGVGEGELEAAASDDEKEGAESEVNATTEDEVKPADGKADDKAGSKSRGPVKPK